MYCCMEHDVFFFFKQKTAYEMRISDWSSDVCSSDLGQAQLLEADEVPAEAACHQLGPARRAMGHGPAGEPRLAQMLGQELAHLAGAEEIGRASCRERVCQ